MQCDKVDSCAWCVYVCVFIIMYACIISVTLILRSIVYTATTKNEMQYSL